MVIDTTWNNLIVNELSNIIIYINNNAKWQLEGKRNEDKDRKKEKKEKKEKKRKKWKGKMEMKPKDSRAETYNKIKPNMN